CGGVIGTEAVAVVNVEIGEIGALPGRRDLPPVRAIAIPGFGRDGPAEPLVDAPDAGRVPLRQPAIILRPAAWPREAQLATGTQHAPELCQGPQEALGLGRRAGVVA